MTSKNTEAHNKSSKEKIPSAPEKENTEGFLQAHQALLDHMKDMTQQMSDLKTQTQKQIQDLTNQTNLMFWYQNSWNKW